jgi:hypothetical protein
MLKVADRDNPADQLSWLQEGFIVAHHCVFLTRAARSENDLSKEKTVIAQMIVKRMHVRDQPVVVHSAIAMLNHFSART